jgi:hypothetical protein
MAKTRQVPIPLPRAPKNFPHAKTRKEKIYIIGHWTLEIIPFIQYPIQINRTERSKILGKMFVFIVIQLCYGK